MIDREKREKVIKGLECCTHLSGDYCRKCPYGEDIIAEKTPVCTGILAHDALKLLKAQEPIIPHLIDWGIYECRICKTRVDKTYKFCKCCGRAVEWGRRT